MKQLIVLKTLFVIAILCIQNGVNAASSKSLDKKKIESLKSKAKIRVAESSKNRLVFDEGDLSTEQDNRYYTRISKLGFNFTLPNVTRTGDTVIIPGKAITSMLKFLPFLRVSLVKKTTLVLQFMTYIGWIAFLFTGAAFFICSIVSQCGKGSGVDGNHHIHNAKDAIRRTLEYARPVLNGITDSYTKYEVNRKHWKNKNKKSHTLLE